LRTFAETDEAIGQGKNGYVVNELHGVDNDGAAFLIQRDSGRFSVTVRRAD
jgi:hypothetical protein